MKVTQKHYEIMDDYYKAIYLEEIMEEAIGYEELCRALLKAMNIDEIIDYLEYIARCEDIEIIEGDEE